MAGDQCAKLWMSGNKFKPYTPFSRKPMALFEKFIWRSGDVRYCWYKATGAAAC